MRLRINIWRQFVRLIVLSGLIQSVPCFSSTEMVTPSSNGEGSRLRCGGGAAFRYGHTITTNLADKYLEGYRKLCETKNASIKPQIWETLEKRSKLCRLKVSQNNDWQQGFGASKRVGKRMQLQRKEINKIKKEYCTFFKKGIEKLMNTCNLYDSLKDTEKPEIKKMGQAEFIDTQIDYLSTIYAKTKSVNGNAYKNHSDLTNWILTKFYINPKQFNWINNKPDTKNIEVETIFNDKPKGMVDHNIIAHNDLIKEGIDKLKFSRDQTKQEALKACINVGSNLHELVLSMKKEFRRHIAGMARDLAHLMRQTKNEGKEYLSQIKKLPKNEDDGNGSLKTVKKNRKKKS